MMLTNCINVFIIVTCRRVWMYQETVFKHDSRKNSSSSNVDMTGKTMSSSQQHADVVTSCNCDAGGDSSYDHTSGLSPWLVSTVNGGSWSTGNSSGRSHGRKPSTTRSTSAVPLTTEL